MKPLPTTLQHKEKAASVLQILDLTPEEWAEVPENFRNLLQRIHQKAQKTAELASESVRLGITGEFSTGKTMLLGSLIGYADALPWSEVASTGNVTVVKIKQQDKLATTILSDFTVTYFSQKAVEDCLRFMLDEAKLRLRAAQLDNSALSAALERFDTSSADVWTQLESWSQKVWAQSKNPNLRFLIRELVLFVRTYTAYGSAMCGKQYVLDRETAQSGLTLTDPPSNLQELKFEELAPAPIPVPMAPQQLNAHLLRLTFPLIYNIELEVQVSKQVWDLSPLQGSNGLTLHDFPGLGAANSSVRDAFLCLNSLDKVQTILILLDGRNPGGSGALPIFDMLQRGRPEEELKDFILMGVGRFDQMPLDGAPDMVFEALLDASEAAVDGLGTENFTDAAVLKKVPALRTHLATVKSFVSEPERMVLLSPLIGLSELSKNMESIQVGSLGFSAQLTSSLLDEPNRIRDYWRQVGDQLKHTGMSPLGKKLSDFSQDGGIGRLQELTLEHISNRGLKQLSKDVSNAYTDLASELSYLKQQSDDTTDELMPAVSQLKTTVYGLLQTYRDLKIGLEKAPELMLYQASDGKKVSVSRIIHSELVVRIFNWEQWNLLFERIQNGTVKLRPSQSILGMSILDDDDDDDDLTESSIPMTSEDFYPVFEQTISDLDKMAREHIHQAITELLQDWSKQVETLCDCIQGLIEDEKALTKQVKQNLPGKPRRQRLKALLLAASPMSLATSVLDRSSLEGTAQHQDIKLWFPLARNEAPHNMAQVFDWAPERKKLEGPQQKLHQFLVLQLRDTLIASASQHLAEVVSEINQKVNNILIEILEEICPALTALSGDEQLLRYLAAVEHQSVENVPKWLEKIPQLTTLIQEEK